MTIRPSRIWRLGRGAAGAQERDAVELGLFGVVFRLALAHLVAFVEQLDLFEVVESLAQRAFRVLKLQAQFVGRTLEVFAARDRRLGIGRIGKMPGIVDAGAILLDANLALEIGCHALEFGDHGFDLRDLAALFVDLKFLQANERLSGLHRLLLPRSQSEKIGAKGRANPTARGPHREDCGTDNVSFRFPRRPQSGPSGDNLPPSWLLLPYLGPGSPRSAYAAGLPRRPRVSTRPDRPQA